MSTLLTLPETVRGLPLHALVVHAVVVLVPLVAFGGLVCVVWPAVRRHFGALVVLGAVGSTLLVPVATGSGKNLARRLGAEELVRSHQQWAGRLLPAMLVLLVGLVALVVLDILQRSADAVSVTPAEVSAPVPAGVGVPAGLGVPGGARVGSPVGADAHQESRRPATDTSVRAPRTVVDRRVAAAMPDALRRAAADGRLRPAALLVSVLVVVAALLVLYVVLQTGESGARAVWGGR